jgi:hypothetical protein
MPAPSAALLRAASRTALARTRLGLGFTAFFLGILLGLGRSFLYQWLAFGIAGLLILDYRCGVLIGRSEAGYGGKTGQCQEKKFFHGNPFKSKNSVEHCALYIAEHRGLLVQKIPCKRLAAVLKAREGMEAKLSL